MAGQKYLITHEMGTLPAGSQMKAYCAMFLEFQEGKIVGQRNCDCFEKW
jgi:hypothetical protein